MARPKVPLISRRKAVEEALNIIDAEGLDAFSIRRLADRLGVNGASLYHHFANKEEIVVRAAELALAKVRTPETNDETWHTWLPRNARLVSEAVRQHPGLVPVIVSRSQLGMGSQMMESSAERLLSEGVPIGAVIPLLDALEIFAIGAAIHETRAGDDDERGRLDPDSLLGRAVDCRALSFEEMYDVVSRAIVESVAAAAEAKTPPAKARRSTKPVAPVRKAAKRAPAKSAPVKSVPVKGVAVKGVAVKRVAVQGVPAKRVAVKGATRSA